MTTLTLTLPLAPTLNHAYLTTRQGRRILTDTGRAYVATAALLAANAAQHQGWCYAAKAPLAVTLRLYFARNNADLDNRIKLTLDGIADGLGFNDIQIVELHGYKAIDKHNPRCEVELVVKG
jgi:Holliday junction resolvase RusA-like endonuclease